MKTDRELLELAARAAGYSSWDFLAGEDGNLMNVYMDDGTHNVWWPFEDDGDALRLMVHLSITIEFGPITVASYKGCAEVQNMIHAHSYERDDRGQVIRSAIVRAAAAIGEAM